MLREACLDRSVLTLDQTTSSVKTSMDGFRNTYILLCVSIQQNVHAIRQFNEPIVVIDQLIVSCMTG